MCFRYRLSAAVPPADAAAGHVLAQPATALAASAIFTHLKPRRGLIYLVDGVQHTDSAFRALEFGPDSVVSIMILRGSKEFRGIHGPRLILIHTSRGLPAKGSPSRSR
jgi:hypothetical protein